jgi:hypothetical protein
MSDALSALPAHCLLADLKARARTACAQTAELLAVLAEVDD